MRTVKLRQSVFPAKSGPAHERFRKGVTLLEVAATTFLFGVLALALLPALASARVSSKESHCFANLMQIGFANAVYASRELSDPALPIHALQYWQDPQEPTFIGAYEWGGKSGIGIGGFGEFPDSLGSKYGTATGFGPSTRPLNTVLYKDEFANGWQDGRFDRKQAVADTQLDLPEVKCPADTGYTGVHFPEFRDSKLSSYDFFGTSYTASMFTVSAGGGRLGPNFGINEMGSNSPYLHRLSELTNTARTLAYYENNGRFAWSATPMPPPCQWLGEGVAGTVMGWHGLPWVFNAAFIDGHADRIFMRSFAVPTVLEEPNAQDSSRCIIVRGENWNKDTLPAPLVPTGLYSGGGSARSSWEGGIE